MRSTISNAATKVLELCVYALRQLCTVALSNAPTHLILLSLCNRRVLGHGRARVLHRLRRRRWRARRKATLTRLPLRCAADGGALLEIVRERRRDGSAGHEGRTAFERGRKGAC